MKGERCRLVIWVIMMMSSAFRDTAWRLSMEWTTLCFRFRLSLYQHVISLSSTAYLWRLPLLFSSSGHGRSRLCFQFGSFQIYCSQNSPLDLLSWVDESGQPCSVVFPAILDLHRDYTTLKPYFTLLNDCNDSVCFIFVYIFGFFFFFIFHP